MYGHLNAIIIIIIIIIIIMGLRDEYGISVGNILSNTDEDIKRNNTQQFNQR